MDDERPDLVRYWFEFDLAGQEPPPASGVTLDGGTLAYRLLSQGVGVTGTTKPIASTSYNAFSVMNACRPSSEGLRTSTSVPSRLILAS